MVVRMLRKGILKFLENKLRLLRNFEGKLGRFSRKGEGEGPSSRNEILQA